MNSPPHIEDCGDHDRELAETFNVHAALVAAENSRPHLKANPRWRLIRMDAYEAYYKAMARQTI